jgi:hypothetical protein
MLGAGNGEIHNNNNAEDTEPSTSDLSMRMASLGLQRKLPEQNSRTIAMRADAALSNLTTEQAIDGQIQDAVHNINADSWRIRAGVEASWNIQQEQQNKLEPFVEAALRHDGGDGIRGNGIEIAAGIRISRPGLNIQARTRWLAAHSEQGAEEKGISLTIRTGQGANGNGPWFTLNPRWGDTTDSASALWNEQLPTATGISSTDNPAALDAELGYGFYLPHSTARLAPFTAATITGNDHTRLKIGIRYRATHPALAISLFSEHNQSRTQPDRNNALHLHLKMHF